MNVGVSLSSSPWSSLYYAKHRVNAYPIHADKQHSVTKGLWESQGLFGIKLVLSAASWAIGGACILLRTGGASLCCLLSFLSLLFG